MAEAERANPLINLSAEVIRLVLLPRRLVNVWQRHLEPGSAE